MNCEIKKKYRYAAENARHYRHYAQTSTSAHVGHFNSNLSCPILPPDHSEETLTTSQIESWRKKKKASFSPVPFFDSRLRLLVHKLLLVLLLLSFTAVEAVITLPTT